MSKKGKNKRRNNQFLTIPRVDLDDRARRSLWVIILLLLGILSLLGLFNLSGNFGQFLSKWLSRLFGLGKLIIPLIIFYFAFLLIRNNEDKRKFSFIDYFGFFLFFSALQTLFHFFYAQETWLSLAQDGAGGGFTGYYLAQAFSYIFGFWGGTIILLALLLIALILVFDTSLSKIIGRESVFFKLLRPFVLFFKTLFSHEDSLEDENEAEEEEEESDQSLLSAWQKKEVEMPAEEESKEGSQEEFIPKKERVGKLSQEEIAWPKKQIKIDLPIELLNSKPSKAIGGNIEISREKIKNTLNKFGIEVEMGETRVGPTVTQYTFRPAEGVKLSRITTLSNDLSLALAAHPIRIEAPIPGKSLVGVEVPNRAKAIVGLREILESEAFTKRKNNFYMALGKDVAGVAWLYDFTRMPHLLVAGATNSGKSVCLNAIIVSLLYQNNPEDLRFIMVDPKRVELPTYNGIPHLLTPVITEVAKTINALKWCLNEMDRRYDLLNKYGKKNIQAYNQVAKEKLPHIVFIIDELADFMMTAGKEMEAAIIRLAQMSRAIGIHLILATQRPSVDVITGLIKANIPSRIACSVASLVDSKTILDLSGAEKLLGQGDMLFSTAELSKPKRIQGAYLSDEEINDVVNYIKEKSGEAEYLEGITDRQKVGGIAGVGLDGNRGDEDELLDEAKELIVKAGKASTSMLQRRLSIGYGRAAKILDMLEDAGIIGPPRGSRPREVLISKEDLAQQAVASSSLHDRSSSEVPDNYLEEDDTLDEGDDGVLDFSQVKTDEGEGGDLAKTQGEELDETETQEEEDEPSRNPLEDDDEMFFAK